MQQYPMFDGVYENPYKLPKRGEFIESCPINIYSDWDDSIEPNDGSTVERNQVGPFVTRLFRKV